MGSRFSAGVSQDAAAYINIRDDSEAIMSSTSAQGAASSIAYVPLSFPPVTDAQGHAGFPANADMESVDRGDGPCKYYELLGASHPRHLMWREKIGQFIAKEVIGQPAPPGRKYIMNSFPSGYELYAHCSRNANGILRRDVYLFGPTNTSKLYKFTSPADFAPHAKWIYRNQPNSRCFCRTCGGKRRQVLRPLLPPIGLVKNHEAKNDSLSCSSGSSITSIEGSQGAAPPKIYREGEVVWVSMLQAGRKPLEESIPFWPGVIANVELELGCKEGCRSNVVGFNVYAVHLLGTTVTTERTYDADIIPYLGYHPSAELNALAAKYEALPRSAIQALVDSWKSRGEGINGKGGRPIALESVTPSYLAAVHAGESIASSYSVDYPCWLPEENDKDQKNQYYQGIWWGCERIWMFDLVRLKAERRQFPDEVQACFLPVSERSSVTGSLFLHISAIYEPKESDLHDAIPSLTGMLYEITAVAGDGAGGASQSTALSSASNEVADVGGKLLPPAPTHSSWKSVLGSGDCVTIPANLIAGRYYPEIHRHPRIPQLGSSPVPETLPYGVISDHAKIPRQLLSLAGLERGWLCQTKSNWRTKVRRDAMQRALATAENRVQEWINRLLQNLAS